MKDTKNLFKEYSHYALCYSRLDDWIREYKSTRLSYKLKKFTKKYSNKINSNLDEWIQKYKNKNGVN